MSDAITCTVLLFAELAERAGVRSIALSLAADATVDAALAAVAADHPGVAPLLTSVAVALDERYTRRDAAIPDGATLALIPPVSGG